MVWFAHLVARSLHAASEYRGRRFPEHLDTARCDEMEAYFYLRSLGYRILAKNSPGPHQHGEIDMIGWDDGVLCFIEVKTLAKVTLAPPEMAVDTEKKQHVRSLARRYLRQLQSDPPPPCRFDVVSVALGDEERGPTIRVHKGVFAWKVAHMLKREFDAGIHRKRWWRK